MSFDRVMNLVKSSLWRVYHEDVVCGELFLGDCHHVNEDTANRWINISIIFRCAGISIYPQFVRQLQHGIESAGILA